VDVYLHAFLTSALVGGEWLASLPGRFTPERKEAGPEENHEKRVSIVGLRTEI
jgi:hypothetical protein